MAVQIKVFHNRVVRLIRATDNRKVGILIRDSPALSRTQIKDYPALSHGQIRVCRRNPGTRVISQFRVNLLAPVKVCRQRLNPRNSSNLRK